MEETIFGTPNADLLSGTPRNDLILGFEGADTVFGNQGSDLLFGNQDGDEIYGGGDGDEIYGGKGADLLFGNRGNDTMWGNRGNDTMYGGQGDDILRGGKAEDVLFGDRGNDVLYGDLGADRLTGGEGLDKFVLSRVSGAPTATTGGPNLTDADVITDFTDGSDLLGLAGGLRSEDLDFVQITNQLDPTGTFVNSTAVRDRITGEFLAILQGITPGQLSQNDVTTDLNPANGISPPPPPPPPSALPDLSITKADSADPVNVGDKFNYTLTVSNTGTSAASNIAVEDILPAGLTPTGNTTVTNGFAANITGQTVSFTGGSIAAGSNATLTIEVTADTTGSKTNTATVDPNNAIAESNETNNSDTETTGVDVIVPPLPGLAIAATNAVQTEGDTGGKAFTFTVTRTGDTTVATTVDYAVTGGTINPADATDFVGGTLPTGTVSFMAGETSQIITLDVNGDTVLEPNENFVVTLSNASGGAAIATPTANGTIQNDDASTLAIAADASAMQTEGDAGSKAFTFTVTRSGDTSGATDVNYAVTGGMTNPADATDFAGGMLPTGTVSFMAGESSQIVTIDVNGDIVLEPDEDFVVTLSNPTVGATIGTATANGTIENDDAISLAIAADASAMQAEGNTGTKQFTFTVTRAGDTSGATTADYALTGGATNPADGMDFGGAFPSGMVSFAAGETSQMIVIDVSGDSTLEPDENFVVTLSNASAGATITTAAANGTIVNDDASLAIAADASAMQPEGNSGNTAFTFTVTRTGDTSGATTVDYAVTGGATPANATDFAGGVLPSGTVNFIAGDASETVTINVNGDGLVEPNEDFVVTLTNPSGGAAIAISTANGTIVNDDVLPTITNIDDGDANDRVSIGEMLTYTITFSKDIDATTVTAADFDNAGTATITIGTPAETTPTSGIFTVTVTPTTTGTIILRVPTGAVISDVVGNNLVVPVQDNDTIAVILPPPDAVNDAPINAIGNVGVNTATGATFSVLTNDVLNGGAITGFDSTSVNGGSVVLNTTTGEFTYTPAPGFEGTDTFTYTLTNGGGSDIATVSINVAGMIWFVDSAASPGGNGTLASPFQSLTPLNTGGTSDALDDPSDAIFVYNAASPYNANNAAGFVLENNQSLIGQGATGASLNGLLGITLPTFSNTLPAINGTRPMITNTLGSGILLASGNTIQGLNVGNANGFGITGGAVGSLNISEALINNTTGGGFNVGTFGALNVVLDSLSSSGGTNGVNLNAATGNFTANSGTITNPTGVAFNINGGSANVTYNGTIAKTNNANNAVNINAKTGGTTTFGGAIAATTSTANAIELTSNTGSTVNFTGALTLNTTSGIGFNATGGGTVSATGTGSAIASTTGTALNVANTTIGASGLNFRSISSNGATNGIVLNNTGASGGLTVTGTGTTAGSGGTIQNSTGTGILLTSTANVNLSNMNVQNSGDDGILGTSVTGFSLNGVNVTNNGNSTTDEGIELVNPAGAIVLTNTNATGNAHNNVFIDDANNTGGNSTLAVSGGTIGNHVVANGNANSGMLITIRGTAILGTSTISGVTFENNRVIGLQVTGGDTANVSDLTVSGNTFRDTGTGNSQEIGLDFSKSQQSNMTAKVLNNTFLGHNAQAMNFFTGAGAGFTGTYNARIEGNVIGNNSVDGSGSIIGNGIRVNMNGDSTNRVLINNNQIFETPNGRGIEVIGRNGIGSTDLTITNNNVDHTNTTFIPGGGAAFPLAAIFVQSNTVTVTGYTVRADVRGNTVTGPGTPFDLLPTYIALVETSTSNLQLVDTAPASADATAQITSTNTGSASANAGVSLIAGPTNTPP